MPRKPDAELRALATIWPSLTEGERKVQLDILKRFIQRRSDLSPADIAMLSKTTVEPQGVQMVLPPPEAKADKAELTRVMTELDALVGLREVKAELRRLAAVSRSRQCAGPRGSPSLPARITLCSSARPAPEKPRWRGFSRASSSRWAFSRAGR